MTPGLVLVGIAFLGQYAEFEWNPNHECLTSCSCPLCHLQSEELQNRHHNSLEKMKSCHAREMEAASSRHSQVVEEMQKVQRELEELKTQVCESGMGTIMIAEVIALFHILRGRGECLSNDFWHLLVKQEHVRQCRSAS